jgi:hypothetical protein
VTPGRKSGAAAISATAGRLRWQPG